MNDTARRTVVTVHIAGEEYAIRTDATEEYTRACAEHVDRTIRDILEGAGMLQPHKVAVLAALAITDQLFQANRGVDDLREGIRERAARLSEAITERLDGRGLATPS